MSRVSDLLLKARETLGDPDGDRFSDARLFRLLNEAQELIAVNTKVLRTKITGTLTAFSSIFVLPEDCITVLRVEWDKVKLPMKSYEEMDAIDPEWQTRFANEPQYVIYDLRLPNRLLLWPNLNYQNTPSTGILTGVEPLVAETVPYGSANSIEGVTLIGQLTYGIITTMQVAPYSLDIYYSRNPLPAVDVNSTIELPKVLDTALKQYMTGMALRDNMDSASRVLGQEELTNAAMNVQVAMRLLSNDYTAATQYNTVYNGGI